MKDEAVSIIVPVYNAENYIKECIESILKQTFSNLELILINDGSTDSSARIIDEYAKKDKRIKPIHIENSGVSTARNIGLQNATGEWVTFVDSDDWIEPDMISFAVKKAKETNADIIMWSYFKNYANQELPLSLLPGGNQIIENEKDKDLFHLKAIYSLYGENRLTESVSSGTVWCKLYKKSLIDKKDLQFKVGLTRAQDTIFSINAAEHASKIVYYEKHLYHYRITTTSTTSGTKYIKNTKLPFNMLLEEFSSFIEKKGKGMDSKYFDAFNGRTIQVLMWHLKHNYYHKQFSGGILKRRKEIINLIEEEPYNTALQKVNHKLLPKKEKAMVILFKRRLILIFYILYILLDKRDKIRRYG